MIEPIINPTSLEIINKLTNNLPQSILLTGEYGIGLAEIAQYICDSKKTKPTIILPEKDEKIDIDKGMITVDIVRRIYDDTRTKAVDRRIIIINYVDRMTHQAQNAFLKLLEEPGLNTHFILLSHSTNNLLPTILSRTQIIKLRPIDHQQSEKLLDSLKVTDKTKRSQMLFIADGLPAELSKLAADEKYFKTRSETVIDAREFIRASAYEKLKIVNKYKDDRRLTLRLILDAAGILKRSIEQKPQSDAIEEIDKLLNVYQIIEANGNIRLTLASIVV